MISATSFGSTQWTRERTSGDLKRVLGGGGSLSGELVRVKGSRQRRRSASVLSGMPEPTRPRVDEFAVVGVVAEQERGEMGPGPLRIRPADDNEFLAVEAFGLAPQTPSSTN